MSVPSTVRLVGLNGMGTVTVVLVWTRAVPFRTVRLRRKVNQGQGWVDTCQPTRGSDANGTIFIMRIKCLLHSGSRVHFFT